MQQRYPRRAGKLGKIVRGQTHPVLRIAKAEILARAEEAKANKQNPAPIFAELQKLLGAYRERHADRLSELASEADRLEARRNDAKLAHVRHGASPRAAIALGEASRAAALLAGRPNVDFADVERVAPAALAHRMVLAHTARLEGVTAADVVAEVLQRVDPLERGLPADVS